MEKLVRSPSTVAKNAFYPFLLYHEEWQPYRKKSEGKPEKKSRPIRYAARRDAYIFAFYRSILSNHYEKRLSHLGISDCPIAYRKISSALHQGGKCNIDFANDAFQKITEFGDCVAVALDIKGYFENLDHQKIYEIWCDLINHDTLPADHQAVFKAITKYRFVDQKEVYRRLGFIKTITEGKASFEKYVVQYKDMPKQLCTPKDFREKICGQGTKLSNLVQSNNNVFGIPQGAPISDLIANFYLLDFDTALAEFASEAGGSYMRYSDDILLIIPGGAEQIHGIMEKAQCEIAKAGPQLELKSDKTCITKFQYLDGQLQFEHVDGPHGKNGFEYLGFRYDGKSVYVRDSTISRLFRKVAVAARRDARTHIARNPKMSLNDLIESFPYSTFSEKFSRVRDFEKFSNNHKNWTFLTYIQRAERIFGPVGNKMRKQISNFDQFMRDRIMDALSDAVDA